jgi:ribosome-binding protein aMBF1 (putative translation factor)
VAYLSQPGVPEKEMREMTQKTCAACDCKLEGETIKVRIGGETVEVCCEDCAQKLREARTAARNKSGR